jgi:hypothetical protein
MSKYKILIKLFELNCGFICCVYGDTIMCSYAVVLAQYDREEATMRG